MLASLRARNLLSYGPNTEALALHGLNVFIGPNGSGKSNLLEIIGLLKAAPENLAAPVKESGGVRDWLYQADGAAQRPVEAEIEVVVRNPKSAADLRHTLTFTEHGHRFEVVDERITEAELEGGASPPGSLYDFLRGQPVLKEKSPDGPKSRTLKREEVHPEQSILSQVKDPGRYPELAHLSRQYANIQMMRDWAFGRYAEPRREQKLGMPSGRLNDTCDNLPLVLADVLPQIEDVLVEHMQALYPRITGVYTKPAGDRLQLFLKEGRRLIPATRLSDGTLRYLCILTALLHPNPAPLICIDEPELGLHPDVLPSLAELLISASARTQLLVTTHSEILVDALQETPESVVTVEAAANGTVLRRLDKKDLAAWLDNYSLGDLWMRGEIGGVRS